MLTVRGLRASYGGAIALDGLDLAVADGEVVAVLGANGAGKSTLLRAISGLIPGAGEITLAGRPLAGVAAHDRVAMGLAHVPEGRHVFPQLTVSENLDLGAYLRRDRAGVRRDLAAVFDLFPRLAERRGQLAGTLSGGEQQMLTIGRALMLHPRLLMLDEPSLGLSPRMVAEVFAALVQLNRGGRTMLVVEQNAAAALATAHRGYVLETGRVITSGSADSLARDPLVREAYLRVV